VSESSAPGLPLAEVRALLDDGLVQLATGEGDPGARRDAALAMMEAIADVDSALADPANFQKGTASALSRIRSAADASSEPPSDGNASAVLARCVEALAGVRWEVRASSPPSRPAGEKPPLRATLGEPAVLDLTRAPILPRVPILAKDGPESQAAVETPPPVEEEPPSLTLAELEAALAAAEAEEPEAETAEDQGEEEEKAAPPPAEAPSATEDEAVLSYFGAALTEEQIVFDRARACMEDLALLGSMRRPLADQGWAGRAEAERRLLARLDAIAACGDRVLPGLVSLLEQRPVPDPELTWALIFLFGSISGEDSAEQAMRLARIAPLPADGMLEAVADAFALAPNPALSALLSDWLSDPAAERRAAAAMALSHRRALTSAQALKAAADEDARVAAAGAAALGTSMGPVDPAALSRLAQHGDESVVRATLESALIRRSPVAVHRASHLVQEGRPDRAGAALLLALASGPDAVDLLLGASARGSICALEALGWYGHPEAIEQLLERLEGESAAPALEALQLVTGASLTDADPSPRYEKGEGPFTAAEGPVPHPEILCAAPEAWRAWWKEHGKGARPGTRYRYGHLWSLGDDLRQMEAPHAAARERRLAYLELCARSGSSLPFDAGAFVAAQRRQISEWSAAALHKPSQGWPVRLERS
jgi:hypothetical protein